MKQGLFITFEGPDGSGKTTVSQAVVQRLAEEGIPVRYTREPGGSRIAEKIRDIILDPVNTEMDARTEALLYAASRRQHLTDIILPALHSGVHVISDRFVDSSLAYQGFGRDLGIEEVMEINRFAIGPYMPVKTVYLDIDPETGLKRIADRKFLDRLDQETEEFHRKVHEGYEEVLRRYADRMVIIDASRSPDEVIADAYAAVRGFIDGAQEVG